MKLLSKIYCEDKVVHREPAPIVTCDNIMAFLFTEYADLYFRKANQMQKKGGGTLTLKNLTKYVVHVITRTDFFVTQA